VKTRITSCKTRLSVEAKTATILVDRQVMLQLSRLHNSCDRPYIMKFTRSGVHALRHERPSAEWPSRPVGSRLNCPSRRITIWA